MKKALCLISRTFALSLEPTGLYGLWAVGATPQGHYCLPAGTTTAPESAYPVDPATLKKAAGFLGKDPTDFDGASLHSGGMSFALAPVEAPVGSDRHLPEAYSCRLKGDDLLDALERVVPYLPKDRAWTDYDNVHVEASEGQVRLVATNGAIMGLQGIDVTDEEGDGAADWTPESIWELMKVLKAFRPDEVVLSWDEKTFQITWGGGAYYTGVAAPSWGIPYRKALPSKASTFALKAKAPSFAKALKAQDKWDRAYRAYVVVTVTPSERVLLEGKGLDVRVDGSIEGYIVTPKDHEKDRIALRQALLLKATKGLGKGGLSLKGNGSMGPVAITSESAPGFLGIIMPVALRVCEECGGLRHECSCEDLGGGR